MVEPVHQQMNLSPWSDAAGIIILQWHIRSPIANTDIQLVHIAIKLKGNYKGILVYEILMDCVARKRIQKTTSNYLNWFPRYCDLIFTSYLINIHEFIYDIIVEH